VHHSKITSSLCLAFGGLLGGDVQAAEFDCAIQPRQVLEVRSPVEGLIDRIAVNRGDLVRKGQELAFIDTSVERVLAEGAKYRSEMSGATRAGQSKVQLSARKLDRAEELYSKAFVAEQVRDDALNEKQLADAELQEARDNRKLAEIEHQRQLTLIRMKTIRSPINGVVMERVQNVGELAEAGVGRKSILKLAEIETLYVEALLPAEAYRQIRVGMVGQVAPAAPEGSVERATVTVIDRVLDAGSGTFGVRLELPNSDTRLLAGVRCKLTLASVKLNTLTGASDSLRELPKPRPSKISTLK
jgi:RND family efflux transporter MFP subunit